MHFHPKARTGIKGSVGAPMPGDILEIKVEVMECVMSKLLFSENFDTRLTTKALSKVIDRPIVVQAWVKETCIMGSILVRSPSHLTHSIGCPQILPGKNN